MLKTKRARAGAIVAGGVVASTIGITALGGGASEVAVGASAGIWGTCTGQQQGVIKSDSTSGPIKYGWVISHITDGTTTPYDQTTGFPSGYNAQQGVKITMPVSPAAIGLQIAQANHEMLTSCAFVFYRPTSTGGLQSYYRLDLQRAQVVSYGLDASPTSGAATTWTFIPQVIQRTWVPTKQVSGDTWTHGG